ncbi:MAG: T9SS type A sorting domain-containing protein [Melioribacteraceae bacterium]|jgi:hypothetical protein|nr:T9SS type A sorting domain-containing protein [Melioribacteraceae bacterium]
MRKIIARAVIMFLIVATGIFIARSFRVNEIPNGNVNTCANCHVSSLGGGPRNAFGTEVENNFLDVPGASGHVLWGSQLAALDSDGDGFTNGEELQDPNGTWTTGSSQPGNPEFVTNPGDPNDFPVPTIIVSSPNGSENYSPDQQVEITWKSNLVANVSIEHSSDNGGSWNELTPSTESDGSFNWIIPNISSTQNLIKVNDLDTDESDQSNSTFTISQPVNPELMVTSPNGGENWEAGAEQTITWISADISSVSISFSTNNGISWDQITSSTISDGNYDWTIPNNIESNECKIRIKDNDSGVEDESNEVFSIFIPLNPQITLITPNGGEELEVGTQFEITWTSTDITDVSIEFSSNNGGVWSEVIASTESDGSFNWTIPNFLSDECLLRISDLNSQIYDENDAPFMIYDPTGVDDVVDLKFALSQNYPNPFNPTTTINFDLAEKSNVELKIYSLNGELVKTILDQTINPGNHRITWDGTNQFGNSVSSGVYLYRLTTDKFIDSKQMILMK